ncbi:MAG: response regulator [Candidatus Eisenbacteria bacterium]|uniref:Response regulator n=1 Tax=Eiseniibacteriota bacterium TaxID=2212470 RepID=A0A948RV90_UNCEI|nr:response regulator [Candidatus Eisenbacteria bacterium]MBU1951142.1 response regulator [Candidatus Eisenbacteria bacterium]MBU2690193.1 response regulator [Candidatus Eisenbacteria bacterium]
MGLNVLVVDDSAVMRAMIEKTLQICGIPINQIYYAGNGVDALAELDKNWMDLALIDINMPVMTGEELLSQLRKSDAMSDLPVIIVSTEGSMKRIAALRQQGAEFVHKPFTPEILRDSIFRVMGLTEDDILSGRQTVADGPDF